MRRQARFVTRDGREVGKSFAKKADAQRWLDEQTADVTRGEFIHNDRQSITVGAIAETWKAHIEQLKPSTRGQLPEPLEKARRTPLGHRTPRRRRTRRHSAVGRGAPPGRTVRIVDR